MKRILGTSAATLLMMVFMVGCGGDGGDGGSKATDGYCADLRDAQGALTSVSTGELTQQQFDSLSSRLATIAGEAPDDVKQSWGVLVDSIDSLKSALDTAGLTLDDLQSLGSGGGPDVDPAKLQALAKAATDLSGDKVGKATADIDKEVKDLCNIDIATG